MKCPKCVIEMHHKKIGQTLIDECPQCKGLWFDQGEVNSCKDELDEDLSWIDFEIWKGKTQFKGNRDPVKCPKCPGTYLTTLYDQEADCDIDLCTFCRGLWLDKNEFEIILNALRNEVNSKQSSYYLKESLNQALEIITGPKSLASEWKDFKTVMRLLSRKLLSDTERLNNEDN